MRKASPPIYTLNDLASITGVTPRTIRLWVEMGVIPRSGVKGGIGPHWSEDHIRAIRQVLKVKDQQVRIIDLVDRFNYREDRA